MIHTHDQSEIIQCSQCQFARPGGSQIPAICLIGMLCLQNARLISYNIKGFLQLHVRHAFKCARGALRTKITCLAIWYSLLRCKHKAIESLFQVIPRHFRFLDKQLMKLLASCLVSCHFDYACISWMSDLSWLVG